MLSFECDYNNGAHPMVMEQLVKYNNVRTTPYGFDEFSERAKGKIREACGLPDAQIFFLTGGTQTNATVISAILKGYEGVISAETGHIGVHEAGSVEFTGHKVLTLPSHQGKILAEELDAYLRRFYADEACSHMVFPGMVYISFPTEYGTIYTQEELTRIREVCLRNSLPLFIDGARLGYGLMSRSSDLDLHELASLCDVFYIGGTKVGALCGEAVVFPSGNAPAHFFTTVKQHGALLAKGRLLGIQFDTLFTDGLYFKISRHAIDMAERLKAIFQKAGIELFIDSPTNQQFVILSPAQMDNLRKEVLFEVWEPLPDGRFVVRFATSWATTEQQLSRLEELLSEC